MNEFMIVYLFVSIAAWTVYKFVRIRVTAPTSWPTSIIAAILCGPFSLLWLFILTEFPAHCVHWSDRSIWLVYVFLILWIVGPLAMAARLIMNADGLRRFLQVPMPAQDVVANVLRCSRCNAVLFGGEETCPQCGVEFEHKTEERMNG